MKELLSDFIECEAVRRSDLAVTPAGTIGVWDGICPWCLKDSVFINEDLVAGVPDHPLGWYPEFFLTHTCSKCEKTVRIFNKLKEHHSKTIFDQGIVKKYEKST